MPVKLPESAAAAKVQAAPNRPAKPKYGDAPAAPTIQTDDVGVAVNFTHAAGKVFFRNPSDGLNYVCSGGTLNTPKQRNLNQFGQKVVARVGGNGIIYDPGRPFVTSIGYPTHVGSGGQLQTFCQGTLSRRNIFNSDQELNCNLRRGASGSVWLKDYDTSFPRLGWAVANYSYFFSDENPSPAFGPYWDTWTRNVRDSAENSSP